MHYTRGSVWNVPILLMSWLIEWHLLFSIGSFRHDKLKPEQIMIRMCHMQCHICPYELLNPIQKIVYNLLSYTLFINSQFS